MSSQPSAVSTCCTSRPAALAWCVLWALALVASCGREKEPPESAGSNSIFGPSEVVEVTTDEPPAPPKADITVLCCGDTMLGRMLGSNWLLAGDTEYPFSEAREDIQGADIAYCHLESQLSDQRGDTGAPNSMIFTGPPEGADSLQWAGIDVVSTAGNHCYDYGKDALIETLDNLDRVKIAHAGTGRTVDEAWEPAIVEAKGWRVAFVSTTNVFNFPREGVPSDHIAFAEEKRIVEAVGKAKGVADLVILCYHDGIEYTPVPAEDAKRYARAAVDAGADAVIGNHPHVPLGWTRIDDRPVFFALGNFVYLQSDPWTWASLVVRLRVSEGKPLEPEVLYYHAGFQPRPATSAEAEQLHQHILAISKGLPGTPPAAEADPS